MNTKLRHVAVGSRLRITGFTESSRYCAQLQRLGLIPGTQVTIMRQAPLGDPIEIKLRGYSLVLRPSEADALEFEVLT